jgi:hypothetical protein
MNQALAIKIAIIAGGVIGGAGVGFGGYKGIQALRRRSAAKKAAKTIDSMMSPVNGAGKDAANGAQAAAA